MNTRRQRALLAMLDLVERDLAGGVPARVVLARASARYGSSVPEAVDLLRRSVAAGAPIRRAVADMRRPLTTSTPATGRGIHPTGGGGNMAFLKSNRGGADEHSAAPEAAESAEQVRVPDWYPSQRWVEDPADKWHVPAGLRAEYAAYRLDADEAASILAGKSSQVAEGRKTALAVKWPEAFACSIDEHKGRPHTTTTVRASREALSVVTHLRSLESALSNERTRRLYSEMQAADTAPCGCCGAALYPASRWVRASFPDNGRPLRPAPTLCPDCVDVVREELRRIAGQQRLPDGRTRQQAAQDLAERLTLLQAANREGGAA